MSSARWSAASVLTVLALASSGAAPSTQPATVRVGDGAQPQLAAGATGTSVYVAYGRGREVLVARSEDGGRTFGPATVAAEVPGMPLGMRRGPRLAATGDTVVVTAIESPKGCGEDGDVYAWTSVDGGRRWTKSARPLNTVAASAREGLHGMASDGKGKIAVVWLDMRSVGTAGGGTEVWVAVSDDGGRTWQPDRRAYVNPGGTVCECCHPSAAFDARGNLAVMFRNARAGDRDMYAAVSADGGRTFEAAEKLGTGSWPLNACPMDGGTVVPAGDDGLLTVWRRGGEVFAARPGSPEERLGQGLQPVAVVTREGRYVAWQRRRGLAALRPGDREPVTLAQDGAYPSLAVTADGSVVAAWEAGGAVFAARVQGPAAAAP